MNLHNNIRITLKLVFAIVVRNDIVKKFDMQVSLNSFRKFLINVLIVMNEC